MPHAPQPADSGKLAILRVWLACAMLYYPAFWFASLLTSAAPALLQASLLDYHLVQFRLGFFGVFAVSAPPSTVHAAYPSELRSSQTLAALLVLAAAGLIAGAGRRNRVISGLTVATLGAWALLPALLRMSFGQELSAEHLIPSAYFFGVLCFGLWWMLPGWPATLTRAGYLWRAGTLTAGFAAMPLLLWLWAGFLTGMHFRESSVSWIIAAGAVATLLVSLLPVRPSSSGPPGMRWKNVGWCAFTMLLLVAAVRLGNQPLNRAFARARIESNRKAMASIPEIPPYLPYPRLFFQRGVNFTAEWPYPYASEGARRMLELLPQYGINAIALVPYGWFRRNPPQVRIQEGEDGWESDEGLAELSRVAHARGIKVMLKPAIWDSLNLQYSSAEDRARWFDQYRLFLEHYARLAKLIHADLLCLGGEFVHLTPYDEQWRKLIARARELYPGPLVYAANFGEEFEKITFWDALDYIGLQEYYPLPDNLSTHSIVQKVQAVQQKYQRPVLFTEVGFPSLATANYQPWDDTDRRHLAAALQASCYEAVFRAFYAKPWFAGMYWWKVETNGTGGAHDGSHSPWEKPAMAVLKRWYLQAGR